MVPHPLCAFLPQTKTSARIYPTYHTAFDTFDYVEKFLDPGEEGSLGCPEMGGVGGPAPELKPCRPLTGFGSHRAVAQTVADVILRLSDSLFLPLNVSDYSDTLRSYLQEAQSALGAQLEQHGIPLGTDTPRTGHSGSSALAPHPSSQLAVPPQGLW